MSNLFRKSALDKISSPEQLNDYLRATTPGLWIAVCAVLLAIASLLIWGFTGRVVQAQSMTGIAAFHEEELVIYSALSMEDARALSAGMEIEIQGSHSAISGKIEAVAILTSAQSEREEGLQYLLQSSSEENPVLARILPRMSRPPEEGAIYDVTVILAEETPISLLFQ